MNKVSLVILALLVVACTTQRIEAKKECQADAHVVLLDTAAPGITTHLINKEVEAKYQACMKSKGF